MLSKFTSLSQIDRRTFCGRLFIATACISIIGAYSNWYYGGTTTTLVSTKPRLNFRSKLSGGSGVGRGLQYETEVGCNAGTRKPRVFGNIMVAPACYNAYVVPPATIYAMFRYRVVYSRGIVKRGSNHDIVGHLV